MQNFQLVLTEHLNHYGYLFGGTLLKWVDESAYIFARLDYPGRSFVTVAMDEVNFKERVELGTILQFDVTKVYTGNTSVTYDVVVSSANDKADKKPVIFSTKVTFVAIGEDGKKCALAA